MIPMFRSLRARLTALFIAMIVIGAFVTLAAVNINTRNQFDRYVQQSDLRRAESLAVVLGRYYRTNGGWNGVGDILRIAERFPGAPGPPNGMGGAAAGRGGAASGVGAASSGMGGSVAGSVPDPNGTEGSGAPVPLRRIGRGLFQNHPAPGDSPTPPFRFMPGLGAAGGADPAAGTALAAARALGPARIVLTNVSGAVIYDSGSDSAEGLPQSGESLSRIARNVGVPVEADGQVVGRLLIGSLIDRTLDPIQQRFLQSAQISVLLSALAVTLVALVLGALFLSGIVRPVHALRLASDQIANGNLDAEVPATGNDEIGDLARSFVSMRDSLRREQETRRRLFRDIAHELRTPVSLLQGEIEAMLDGIYELSPKNLASLQDEVRILARLISDVQMVAAFDAGSLELQLEPVDVQELCSSLDDRFRRSVEAAGVVFSVRCDDDVPTIVGDRDRLIQVLGNLVTNALAHAQGATTISVVASRSDEGSARIAVVDDGPGVPSESLSKIFDRMFRLDAARSRKTGGSGLGLSIAKSIIEAHHGTIVARSPAGSDPDAERRRGLAMIITLPGR